MEVDCGSKRGVEIVGARGAGESDRSRRSILVVTVASLTG